MGNWYDARFTPDGWRFRCWSSVVDRYLTPPMTEAETRAMMLGYYTGLELRTGIAAKDVDERLERARTHGTTEIGGLQELTGPWETERCNECGGFHHGFRPRGDGTCSACGEPEGYGSHAPPCPERDRVTGPQGG